MSHRKLVEPHQNAVAAHLRRIHPTKTAECVAADIGVPAETVRQWLRGAASPSGPAMLALVGVYGPELLAVALPNAPGWLRRALVAEKRRAAMDELRALTERLGAMDNEPIEGPEPSRLGRVVGRRVCGDLRPLRDGVRDAAGG
jgi:hypothetical protein